MSGLILIFLMMQPLLISTGMKALFVCICLLFCLAPFMVLSAGGGGLSDSDLRLLETHIRQVEEKPVTRSGILIRDGDGIRKYNPVAVTLGGLMAVYQRFISPQLPSECLYHPSCSAFSMNLIREYGLIKGVAATSDRLMRCNRVAAIDVHPMHIREDSGKAVEEVGIYRKNGSKVPE